jgi:hypothetical protein
MLTLSLLEYLTIEIFPPALSYFAHLYTISEL